MNVIGAFASIGLATVKLIAGSILDVFGTTKNLAKTCCRLITFNICLWVFAGLIALVGFSFLNVDQTNTFKTLDALQECGGVPLLPADTQFTGNYGAFVILQYAFIPFAWFRSFTFGFGMAFDSGLVYVRQTIYEFVQVLIEFFAGVADWSDPFAGIVELLTIIGKFFLTFINVFIEVQLLRIPVLGNLFESIYIATECIVYHLAIVGRDILTWTIVAENCAVCELNEQLSTADRCIFSTQTLELTVNQVIVFPTPAEQCATGCRQPLCAITECIGSGVKESLNFFLEPCFNISVTSYVDAAVNATCCTYKALARLLWAGIGFVEHNIRLFFISPPVYACVDLSMLNDQLNIFLEEIATCLSDLVCALNQEPNCDFKQIIIIIVEQLEEVVNAIFAISECGIDPEVLTCLTRFPTVGSPSILNGNCGNLRGLSACSNLYFMCLEQETLWLATKPFLDLVQQAFVIVSELFCAPYCLQQTSCQTFDIIPCFFFSVRFSTCLDNIGICLQSGTYIDFVGTFFRRLSDVFQWIENMLCWIFNLPNRVGACGSFPNPLSYFGLVPTIGEAKAWANAVLVWADCLFGALTNPAPITFVLQKIPPFEFKHTNPILACILLGTQHSSSDCINGCYYEEDSCKEISRTKWDNDVNFALTKIRHYESLEYPLPEKCGGPKFYSLRHNTLYRIYDKHIFNNTEYMKYLRCLLENENLNLTVPTIPDFAAIASNFSKGLMLKFKELDDNQSVGDAIMSAWYRFRMTSTFDILQKMSVMKSTTFKDECARDKKLCTRLKAYALAAILQNYTNGWQKRQGAVLQLPYAQSNSSSLTRPYANSSSLVTRDYYSTSFGLVKYRHENPMLPQAGQVVKSITSTAYCFLTGETIVAKPKNFFELSAQLPKMLDLERHGRVLTGLSAAVKRYYKVHQWKSYQFLHMMVYANNTRDIAEWMSGKSDLVYNPLTTSFEPGNFTPPVPSGPEIWNANGTVNFDLGMFLTGFRLSQILALTGLNISAGPPNIQSIFEIIALTDEQKCFDLGMPSFCRKILARDHELQYETAHMPRKLKSLTKEMFKSEESYRRYLLGQTSSTTDYNQVFYNLLLNTIEFVLRVFTAITGVTVETIKDAISQMYDTLASIDVADQFIFFLRKLDVALNCRWPANVNGETIYNFACLPLLPVTLGKWITPVPNLLVQPQIQWPKSIIKRDCINSYTGNTFFPLSSSGSAQNDFLSDTLRNLYSFQISNNCINGINLFAKQVIIKGGVVALGQPYIGQNFSLTGSVGYYDIATKQELARAYGLNVLQAEQFGSTMDYDPVTDTLIVGAPNGEKRNGYACIYEFLQTEPQLCLHFTDILNETEIIQAQTAVPLISVQYSFEVLISQNFAFVAAPYYNSTKGRVYLYDRNDDYALLGHLEDYPALPSKSLFGFSMAIDHSVEQWLVVSQPYYNNSVGQVFIYAKSGTMWLLETILSFPDLMSITSSDKPVFGWSVTTKGQVVCVGAPGYNTVYCFKRIAPGNWANTIVINDVILNGFGNVTKMNATHIFINEDKSPVVKVYQFNGAYTTATLVESIAMPSTESMLDLDFDGNSATSIYGFQNSAYFFPCTATPCSLEWMDFEASKVRKYCDKGCDFCPREYEQGGCRHIDFRDFVDSFAFLAAFLPQILNFLFKNGIKLTFLEQTFIPLLFLLDLVQIVLFVINVVSLPGLGIVIAISSNLPLFTIFGYAFLWTVQLLWGDGLPAAPLIILLYVVFFIPLPAVGARSARIRQKLQIKALQFVTVVVWGIMFVELLITLFSYNKPFSFSLPALIVKVLNRIQNFGLLTPLIFSFLTPLKQRFDRFAHYADPASLPYDDIVCFFLSFYNIFAAALAIPFFLFLGIFALFFLVRCLPRIPGWWSSVATDAATIGNTFRLNT
jgi:hypothetical protein